jgi:catechol 2,3-dioxygenase-like lactoylglutathione lyase family enzyme
MSKRSLCAAALSLASIPILLSFAQTPEPAPGLRLEGSLIAAVEVRDIEASKRWYKEILGANVYYELPDKTWCELTTPVANAFIGLSKVPEPKGSGGATFSIGVKDMAKAKEFLLAHKVKLEGDIVEIPQTVKLLGFSDPDGNKLMLYEPFSH